jgi:cystathionine beta-synthase
VVLVQYVNSLIDLIGNTPLLRLSRTLDLPQDPAESTAESSAESGPVVLAKIEYLNPGGS